MTDLHHDEPGTDIPAHINDRDGIISVVMMGLAIILLVLLVIAVVQAI